MRLYAYELYKALSRRTVRLAAAAMFCACLALFAVQSYRTDSYYLSHRGTIAAVEAEYANRDPEEAYADLAARADELNALWRLQLYADLAEENDFYVTLYDELFAEYGDLLERYADSPLKNDPDARRELSFALNTVREEYAHITTYRSFIEGMQERADTMLHASIFSKKGSFSNNNIQKTPKDFAPFASLVLSPGSERGIAAVSSFRIGDLLVPAAVFLLCIVLFLHEYDTGLARLVRTTVRGRGRTAAAKLAALVTLTAAFSALLYAGLLAAGGMLYGYGDLSRPIQSCPSFRDCTLPVSVGGYLLLFWLAKLGASVLTAALAALFFAVCGGGKSAFTAMALFAAASFVCFRFIHSASWLNLLKYVNIFSFWDVYGLFRLYININFFSIPLNRVLLCSAAGLLVFPLCLAVSAYFWAHGKSFDFAARLFGRLGARLAARRRARPLAGSVGLARHELRKCFLTGRAWVYPAAALLVTALVWDTAPLKFATVEEAAYKLYANYWSGPLTPEKIDEIESEAAYLASIPSRLDALSESHLRGELDDDAYRSARLELSAYTEKRSKGFQTFYQQYTEVMSLPKGVPPAIVDNVSADYWFDNETRDLLRGLLCVLLCILACARIFPLDGERGLFPLLGSTANGRAPLVSAKLLSALTAAVLIWVLLYAAPFVTLFAKYRLSFISDIRNTEAFRQSGAALTVGALIALASLWQLFTVSAVSVWTLWLSRKLRRASLGLLFSAALWGLPFLLSAAGVDVLTAFSPVAAFTPYQSAAVLGARSIAYMAGVLASLGGGIALLYRERSTQ
ncbi:MAG: hypothetical protein MR832_07940 [Clostridiales bacterium]|nr:hypothetical protein [Clostridiales bacterium]